MTLKVYIHVGPPKTATSAIQNWLQTHRDVLMSHGVFYPEHTLDENGVSSGNVLDVFDRTFDKKLILSHKKVEKLVQHCEESSCDTLLLSSEFFFFQITELLEAFPQAKFIAYIRFPLDVIESSYNQAVKRHAETKPLGLPQEPKAYHLNLLKKQLNEFGTDKFIVRFYEKDVLQGSDIVSDFISALNIDIAVTPSKVVNHSYSFDALELKRWLNNFMPVDCQHRVDRFLQSYRVGTMSYSLIQPQKYDYYKNWFLQQLTVFFEQYPIDNNEVYIAKLSSKQQPQYCKQEIDQASFDAIVKALVEWDFGLSQVLIKHAQNNSVAMTKRPELFNIFVSYVSHQYRFKVWVTQTYYSGYHRLRNFYRRITSIRQDSRQISVSTLDRFRQTLQIDDKISDAEVYRELALLSEQNGELQLAYRFMKKADELRPNGPVITAKLSEYQDKLNVSSATENPNK
ncbi:hypothetical protein [Aliiglaciecola litoralis]|uniref:Sulfotransferase family protein n=1 Tax=Aliiglaciecola litoralis TaxID=582857 RepID=A0ABN1LWN8_9ALTE